MTSNRINSLDIWRGASIMLVISSHLFWGLYSDATSANFQDPFVIFFALTSTVGQMFFFVSGCSQIISMEKYLSLNDQRKVMFKKEIKKGLLLVLIGYLYDPVIYWHLGTVDTLQIIGLSYLIMVLFLKGKSIDAKTREKQVSNQSVLLVIIISAISPLMRALIGYPVYDPSVEFLVYCRPPVLPVEFIQVWITTSFFPVFPWLAFFFAGSYCAVKLKDLQRKNIIHLIKIGILLTVAGLVLILVGEFIAGDLLALPQNEQEWWVVELSFNVQPLTSCAFLFYLGLNFLAVGVLSFIYDMEHSIKTSSRIERAHLWWRLEIPMNAWVHFSHVSLTIYILQYIWIPVLRAAGLLYSIDNTSLLVIIILLAWIGFAYLAKWLDHARRSRFTFEMLLERAIKPRP